jgi:hypothetical protein
MLDRLEQPGTRAASVLDVYLRHRWYLDVRTEDAVPVSAQEYRPLVDAMVELEATASDDSRYWRWRSEIHWVYARRLKVEGADDMRVLEVQQRAVEDAERALRLAPEDLLAQAEVARAWFFRAYAFGESSAHTPAEFARAAEEALPHARRLAASGHPHAGMSISRTLELIASARARLAEWTDFMRWASQCIEIADDAAATHHDNILVVRNAEACRFRLAANLRDTAADVPTPVVEAALDWAQDAHEMYQARRRRGWVGPVEDGRYDAYYAFLIEHLRARLAAQVPEPAQPDTQR